VAWTINGNLGRHARSGVDAGGWLWEIERESDGYAAHVVVEISGSADAMAPERLPEETRVAIETMGRSEVEKILNHDEPPRVIQCGTMGCHGLSAEEVRGQS
jgi:hypothetical protein